MLKYELKKLIGNKFLCIIFAFLFLLNAFLSFYEARNTALNRDYFCPEDEWHSEIFSMYERYESDPDAFMKEYEAFIDKYKENNPDVEIILCTPAKAFFKNGESKGEKTKFDIRPDIVDTIRYEIRAYALVGAYKWVDI